MENNEELQPPGFKVYCPKCNAVTNLALTITLNSQEGASHYCLKCVRDALDAHFGRMVIVNE
jgi:hypothetical protein